MTNKSKTDIVVSSEPTLEETNEQLLDKIIVLEELNKTQKELTEAQTKTIEFLKVKLIKSANLINQCLTVLQREGYNIRSAGANIERFYEDNKNDFLNLILLGRKMSGIDLNDILREREDQIKN